MLHSFTCIYARVDMHKYKIMRYNASKYKHIQTFTSSSHTTCGLGLFLPSMLCQVPPCYQVLAKEMQVREGGDGLREFLLFSDFCQHHRRTGTWVVARVTSAILLEEGEREVRIHACSHRDFAYTRHCRRRGRSRISAKTWV